MKLVFVIYQNRFTSNFHKTFSSLRHQTNQNFNLMLVEDSGVYNADSQACMRSFNNAYRFFSKERVQIVFNHQSQGFTYACNTAIDYAKGEYIIFVYNGQTVFAPDFVAKFLALLNRHKNKACDVYEFNIMLSYKKQEIWSYKMHENNYKQEVSLMQKDRLALISHITPLLFNKAFKAEMLRANKLFMRAKCHYYVLFLYKVLWWTQSFCHADINQGFLLLQPMEASLNDLLRQWVHVFNFYRRINSSKEEREMIEYAYFKYIILYFLRYLYIIVNPNVRERINQLVYHKMMLKWRAFKNNAYLKADRNPLIQTAYINPQVYFDVDVKNVYKAHDKSK